MLPKGRKNFLTVYPNIQLSVKDTEDPKTHEPIVATAEMLNAANGKSRLGCTVAAKFSRQFSDEVSWQKVDPQAAAAASGEEDITEGGDRSASRYGDACYRRDARTRAAMVAAATLRGSWRSNHGFYGFNGFEGDHLAALF